MTTNILFCARDSHWPIYRPLLEDGLTRAGIDHHLSRDLPPDQVDYIVYAPSQPIRDFGPYTRLRAVLSLWAGVEKIAGNPTLRVPLARMVDEEGLTQGMVEWVTGHVLRHHLGMDAHIVNPGHRWDPQPPPLARDRPVTILGLGQLGGACARALRHLGFPVTGWSRREKRISGISSLHGDESLPRALNGAQVLVLLLPLTPQTESLIDAHALARLAPGAVVLNPGRGALIDDTALIDALDSGHLSHATLDVFREEPLPPDHRFWAHPRVTVTPHVASETRPESAARVIVENIRRGQAGKPLLHLVDPHAGY